MLEEEEISSVEEAGEMHSAGVKTAVPETAEQQHEKFDLRKVEKDLFDFFSKAADAVPDWVPVVAPYLKAKKAEWEAMATLHGSNLSTGEKIETLPEGLQLFVEKFFSGFFNEGRTVMDLLLILGTGGSGNVALGVEKVAAQKIAGSAGKITLESMSAKIAQLAAGGEGAALDLIPGFFKGLAEKLAKHPKAAETLLEAADVYSALQKIPGVKALMEQMLAKQEWWQKLSGEFKSSTKRAQYGQEIIGAVGRVGYSQQPNPA